MKKMTRYVSLTTVIFVIVLTVACGGVKESPESYVSDSWITSKVKSALLADPLVSGFDVQVETYKGIVQLSGFVNSREQADEAVKVARSIKGVKGVENRMTIR
jgi:hyperosmotically inducible protein